MKVEKKVDKIYVYTDGASRGNPGPAAVGVVILDEDKNILIQHKRCIGNATNNQAEYTALINGLELAAAICKKEVVCFLDSELVVNHLRGAYRVKDEKLRNLFSKVKEKEAAFKKITFNYTRRSNLFIQMVDKLANQALDGV